MLRRGGYLASRFRYSSRKYHDEVSVIGTEQNTNSPDYQVRDLTHFNIISQCTQRVASFVIRVYTIFIIISF